MLFIRRDVFPFEKSQQYVEIFPDIFQNQGLAFSSHGFVSLLDCLHYSMRWPQYSALQLDYQTRARADSLTSDKSGEREREGSIELEIKDKRYSSPSDMAGQGLAQSD